MDLDVTISLVKLLIPKEIACCIIAAAVKKIKKCKGAEGGVIALNHFIFSSYLLLPFFQKNKKVVSFK